MYKHILIYKTLISVALGLIVQASAAEVGSLRVNRHLNYNATAPGTMTITAGGCDLEVTDASGKRSIVPVECGASSARSVTSGNAAVNSSIARGAQNNVKGVGAAGLKNARPGQAATVADAAQSGGQGPLSQLISGSGAPAASAAASGNSSAAGGMNTDEDDDSNDIFKKILAGVMDAATGQLAKTP